MSIQTIIDGLIEREGGYVDSPDDRGGKTCWGITEAVARQNGYAGTMRNLPRAFAVALYERRYVTDPGFDKVIDLSPRIAEELVDTGVNMGPAIPGVWLQRTLNAMNRQAKDYADIQVDGKIGPGTMVALRALLDRRGTDGEVAVLRMLNCLQGVRYLEITEGREKNETFLFGWLMNRVEIV